MYYIYAAHVENTDSKTGKRIEGCNLVLKDDKGNTLRERNDLQGGASVISDLEMWYTQTDIEKLDGVLVSFHYYLNGNPTESLIKTEILGVKLKFQCRIGENYLQSEREKFPALKAAVRHLIGL